jgi:hypothetical protein
VTCHTQPCKPCKVKYVLDYLPQGDESSPRGGWGICAPALPEVLTYCLGRIGWDRVCLLQTGMSDVRKHKRHRLEVKDPMIHSMTPGMKQTRSTAYEVPDLAVYLLTDAQYGELTREQHSVGEWNRILLAIKERIF